MTLEDLSEQSKDAIITRLTWELEQTNANIKRIERDNEECRAIMAACHKMTGFEIPQVAVLNLLESAQ